MSGKQAKSKRTERHGPRLSLLPGVPANKREFAAPVSPATFRPNAPHVLVLRGCRVAAFTTYEDACEAGRIACTAGETFTVESTHARRTA